MADTEQTLIARVIVGTPVRKVTGAQAQGLDDLTDVNIPAPEENQILQYNETEGKWNSTSAPAALVVSGGTF